MLLGRFAPMQDLLLYAKHLFREAMVQKTAAVRQRRSEDGRRARPNGEGEPDIRREGARGEGGDRRRVGTIASVALIRSYV